MSNKKPHILILAHIVEDAAVQKRASMLRAGGAHVTIAGFRRSKALNDTINAMNVIHLGRTYNGQFFHRAFAVIRALLIIISRRSLFRGADIIIARNLEMLFIARWARFVSRSSASIVYEVLDIHRLMLSRGFFGEVLRRLEGILTSTASLVLTSSPAFVSNYFLPISHVRSQFHVVENKVATWEGVNINLGRREEVLSAPPWVVGWFGIIRCRKSLHLLCDVVKQSAGRIKVIVRGLPALNEIPEFHELISRADGIRYEGPYKNPDDLAKIYSEIHFIWAVDQFEEGQNSKWLLPNRLYEGLGFGVVPIAEKDVETGRYLAEHGVGILLDSLSTESVKSTLDKISAENYQTLKAKLLALPAHCWRADDASCHALVSCLSEKCTSKRKGGINAI